MYCNLTLTEIFLKYQAEFEIIITCKMLYLEYSECCLLCYGWEMWNLSRWVKRYIIIRDAIFSYTHVLWTPRKVFVKVVETK